MLVPSKSREIAMLPAAKVWVSMTSAAIILAALVGGWLYWQPASAPRSAAAAEKMVIAINNYIGTGLVVVAAANGYFTEAGLDVTLQGGHASGQSALAAALAGKADLATVGDTPLMFAVLRGQPLAIVATLAAAGQDIGIVARKDRGIATLGDLRGRRVATTLGTGAHYMLDALLTSNKIPIERVRLSYLKPELLADALAKGEVDAIATWEPYLAAAARAVGDNGIAFGASSVYILSYNLAGRQDFVKQHPQAMQRLMRALLRAQQFVQARPADSRAIVARALEFDLADMERAWPQYDLRLSLDQGLITRIEAQAAWAIRQRLVDRPDVPNFLDHIYLDPVTAVKPDAVSIIR